MIAITDTLEEYEGLKTEPGTVLAILVSKGNERLEGSEILEFCFKGDRLTNPEDLHTDFSVLRGFFSRLSKGEM